MAQKRGPWCTVCMRAGEPVLLEFFPAHHETREYARWGTPVRRQELVPPQARVECAKCGRESRVQVEPDWTPAEWDGASRI